MNNAPSNSDIEISIFGPGIGEAIAFHYKNSWILIDSCIDHIVNKPTTLQYLQSLSVDIESSVKLIILTHWHDDHIKGAYQLIHECRNAQIVLPNAFEDKNFRKLAIIYAKRNMVNPNGFDEVTKIIQHIVQNKRNFCFGSVDTLLLQETIDADNLNVYSISPSSYAKLMSDISISSLIESHSQRINPPKHNYFSIGTLININNESYLFGADLENLNNDQLGWEHVINHCICIKNKKSQFYKISHHGSYNGDNAKIWSEFLIKNPIVAITPYSRGKIKLPSESDFKRIKKQSRKVYLTCKEPTSKFKDKATLKATQKILKNLKIIAKNNGHIRIRINTKTKEENIELINNAVQL